MEAQGRDEMNPVRTLVFLFLTHTIATAIACSDQLSGVRLLLHVGTS